MPARPYRSLTDLFLVCFFLNRLRTTASVLYTAAHPDDEQGGVLTYVGGEERRVKKQ